jgi:hypothetical protein
MIGLYHTKKEHLSFFEISENYIPTKSGWLTKCAYLRIIIQQCTELEENSVPEIFT